MNPPDGWHDTERALLLRRLSQLGADELLIKSMWELLREVVDGVCVVCGSHDLCRPAPPRPQAMTSNVAGLDALFRFVPRGVVCSSCVAELAPQATLEDMLTLRERVLDAVTPPAALHRLVAVRAPEDLSEPVRASGCRCEVCGDVELRVPTSYGTRTWCPTCADRGEAA